MFVLYNSYKLNDRIASAVKRQDTALCFELIVAPSSRAHFSANLRSSPLSHHSGLRTTCTLQVPPHSQNQKVQSSPIHLLRSTSLTLHLSVQRQRTNTRPSCLGVHR